MAHSSVLPRIFLIVALLCALALPCFADSKARAVRLSDVQGEVQVDRNIGQGFERAFLNLPLTQGVKIRTQEHGQAALEFEDGSTVRLVPNTTVELPQLLLRDSGVKFSSVNLQEGTAYIDFLGTKDNIIEVMFAREKLILTQPAHLRIVMADVDASVAVFKGQVSIAGPKGTAEVTKNHTASFDLLDDHYSVASNIDEYPYDSWDKQQAQYQQRYSDKSYSDYSPYAYGSEDLNYYGSFFTLPGYGMLWQPYFIGAGWDPFMNGAWAYYPGSGYGWVSAYPWGWTPYHCGNWTFLQIYGWAWQPSAACGGWYTLPAILNAPLGFVAPCPPKLPGRRIFPLNRGPVPAPTGNKVRIATNSGGLGIPRGSFRNLGQLSEKVEQRGFVTATVHTTPVSTGWWHAGTAPVSRMGTAIGHGFSSSTSSMSSGHVSGGGHSSGGGGHR
jgi:hypothetical protein